MRVLRIVATRLYDFDPAYLSFQRLCCGKDDEHIDLVVEIPHESDDQAYVLLNDSSGEAKQLHVFVMPRGNESGDGARLEACEELFDCILEVVDQGKISFIHAFSWNLRQLINRLCSLRKIPGLVSFRGLDVMKGVALNQVMYSDTQADEVHVHYPSYELAHKSKILKIGRNNCVVTNGIRLQSGHDWASEHSNEVPDVSKYDTIILIPGNVGAERGLIPCLQCLANVVGKGCLVLLVGSRGFLITDEELVAHSEMSDFPFDITLIGPLAHSQLMSCLRYATFAICPGGREGGQSSILECISENIPVLLEGNWTNRVNFGRDAPYVYDGRNIKLEDLAYRSITDPTFREDLRFAQRKRLEETLSTEVETRKFESLYRAISTN